MRKLHITTAWGIRIRVNISLPVLVWIVGSGAQVEAYADIVSVLSGVSLNLTVLTAGQTPWVIGTTAVVGLFASVALHELGHDDAARRYRLRVESITLWIPDGLASLETMPKEWDRELVITLVGPAVSVLTELVCYAALSVLPASAQVTLFVYDTASSESRAVASATIVEGLTLEAVTHPLVATLDASVEDLDDRTFADRRTRSDSRTGLIPLCWSVHPRGGGFTTGQCSQPLSTSSSTWSAPTR